MKVLIIEDEKHNAELLADMLMEIDPEIEICAVLESIRESVDYLSSARELSLIFMDIRLSDGLCFEIFSALEVNVPVVFTTAYDEYAIKAFKVNSIDYLLKPVNRRELEGSLRKYRKLTANHTQNVLINDLYTALKSEKISYRRRFLVQRNASLMTIDVQDIIYIYSEYKNTFLVLNDYKSAVNISLDDLENELDPRYFFRANRQHIIKVSSVSMIHIYFKGKLKLVLNDSNKTEVIISKEKAPFFKKWLDA